MRKIKEMIFALISEIKVTIFKIVFDFLQSGLRPCLLAISNKKTRKVQPKIELAICHGWN